MSAHRSGGLPARAANWRVRLADARGRGVYSGYPNEHHCIFVHIPKTAGSSIATALFGTPSSHVTAQVYLDANPNKFRRFFKFAFVRNPWDRLVSTYAFLKRGGMNDLDAAFSARHVEPFDTFDAFVRGKLETPEVRDWVHFWPQTKFVCDGNGRMLMDFLGRYERLDEDFSSVASRLGRDLPLPRTNVSTRGAYTEYYTPETRDLVGRLYASDVAAFDYVFGS